MVESFLVQAAIPLWGGVIKNFRWAYRIIKTSTEFVFSIPGKYLDADAFARFLIDDLGLNLKPPDDKRTFWSGRHLGFQLDFIPDHKLYDDPEYVNDDQNIDYGNHKSIIGLTGSGSLRIALIPMMLNIALSICYLHEFGGYLLGDGGDLLAHIEWNSSKSQFWNTRDRVPLVPTEIRNVYRGW